MPIKAICGGFAHIPVHKKGLSSRTSHEVDITYENGRLCAENLAKLKSEIKNPNVPWKKIREMMFPMSLNSTFTNSCAENMCLRQVNSKIKST